MNKFSVNDTGWMITPIDPTPHITTNHHKNYLKTYDYMVGPKADGERMLLLCDGVTMDLYLLCKRSPPFKLEGKYLGYCRGFLLDVEVITMGHSTRLILPFDVAATGSVITQGAEMKVGRRKLLDRHWWLREPFLHRHSTLKFLVKDMSQCGVFVKPIAPANDALQMKPVWENLPFKTDGLIFTPCSNNRRYSHRPVLKWKPKAEVTLDVAVGGPLEQAATHSRFLAHIHVDQLQFACQFSNPFGPGSLPQAQFEAVPPKHQPFQVSASKILGWEDWRNWEAESSMFDNRMENEEELWDIFQERKQESTGWDCNTKDCSHRDCPCGETLPDLAEIRHCYLCGALGVAERGNEFCCKVNCRAGCMIWIPNEDVERAKHGIVEVAVGINPRGLLTFSYKRTRPDKTMANTISVVDSILSHMHILLEHLDIKGVSKEKTSAKLQPRSLQLSHTKAEVICGFANLRSMHYKLKGWLYRAFGGYSILDVCSGSLRDISNWASAHISKVVSVERDPEQCQQGHDAIGRYSSTHNMLIELVETDLSMPTDLATQTFLATQQVDAVFCNFAIHYLWDKGEKTKTFFENTIPHLREGGRFVVTFMQGDLIANSDELCIHDALGNLALEVQVLDDDKQTASVYVDSIGKAHEEAIVYLEDLKEEFASFGLQFLAFYPFKKLRNLFPETSLSVEEAEMSSFYAAAVFEKGKPQPGLARSEQSLFHPSFDALLEHDVLKYLTVPELVRYRLLSQSWKKAIDGFVLPEASKQSYFGGNKQKVVEYDSDAGLYCLRNRETPLNPRALAQYFRFGGSPVEERPEPEPEPLPRAHYRLYGRAYVMVLTMIMIMVPTMMMIIIIHGGVGRRGSRRFEAIVAGRPNSVSSLHRNLFTIIVFPMAQCLASSISIICCRFYFLVVDAMLSKSVALVDKAGPTRIPLCWCLHNVNRQAFPTSGSG